MGDGISWVGGWFSFERAFGVGDLVDLVDLVDFTDGRCFGKRRLTRSMNASGSGILTWNTDKGIQNERKRDTGRGMKGRKRIGED